MQIESFAITDLGSKGVLIKGIYQNEFQKITDLNLVALKNGVAVGVEFAKYNELKIGDVVTFAMASSKAKNQGVAILKEFEIEAIVKHGVYEKDMRVIYMDKSALESTLSYKAGIANMALIKIDNF